MILIRFILIFLIIYLIVRYALEALESKGPEKPVPGPENKSQIKNKKVSKKIGEYIDYEELDDRK
jgi:hypothetical protein